MTSEPGFWDDSQKAKAITKELDEAKSNLAQYEENLRLVEDAEVLVELAEEADEETAWKEAEEKIAEARNGMEAVEFRLMLSQPEDKLGAILTINAGAGGTESCDWAAMLNRMYLRYCERQGFKVTELDQAPGDEAGIKSITLSIDGNYAYGYLKAENG
ncbi:MAG: PCRF domain-containing protein, partial [bacterium]|nr:PCRF domain-containing protein [bacterium]